jgi:hypothetical protein
MKTKVVVLLSGALIALLLLSRYFALSRAGMPLGWMLYLGLPITAAGVLFALRLINLCAGWGTKIDHLQHTTGTPPHPRLSLSQPAVSFPNASRSLRPCMPMAPSLTRSTAHGVCRSSRRCETDATIPARSGEW